MSSGEHIVVVRSFSKHPSQSTLLNRVLTWLRVNNHHLMHERICTHICEGEHATEEGIQPSSRAIDAVREDGCRANDARVSRMVKGSRVNRASTSRISSKSDLNCNKAPEKRLQYHDMLVECQEELLDAEFGQHISLSPAPVKPWQCRRFSHPPSFPR